MIIYSLSHDIYALHFNRFVFKNTHTCERIAIEIDEMENLKYIFFNTVSFSQKKITVTKTDVLRTYIMGNVYSVHLFFIWKSLGILTQFSTSIYHSCTFIAIAMVNPSRCLKWEVLGFFHTIKKTSSKPKGIWNYRIM